jgi:hypothetical protein
MKNCSFMTRSNSSQRVAKYKFHSILIPRIFLLGANIFTVLLFLSMLPINSYAEINWNSILQKYDNSKKENDKKQDLKEYDEEPNNKSIGITITSTSNNHLEWYAGPNKSMTWYEANNWIEKLEGSGWRLPSSSELSDIHSNESNEEFDVPGYYFWTKEVSNDFAEVLYILDGSPYTFLKSSNIGHVIAVRNKNTPNIEVTKASDIRVEKSGYEDIIVKNGLEWYVGPDVDTNWNEADEWVRNLKVGGGGWRMPTRYELERLYQKGLGSRNMDTAFKTTGWYVWSGETTDASSAWCFCFGSGYGGWINRNFSYATRAFAVRSRR